MFILMKPLTHNMLLTSKDNGQTWAKISTPTNSLGHFLGITAGDGKTVAVCNSDYASSDERRRYSFWNSICDCDCE